jgi:hypothetical protein
MIRIEVPGKYEGMIGSLIDQHKLELGVTRSFNAAGESLVIDGTREYFHELAEHLSQLPPPEEGNPDPRELERELLEQLEE